jgi:hypothetical protein
MDDVAFDRLTRLFGSSRPRRDAMRAAFGLVFTGAVISRNPDVLADDRNDESAGEAIAEDRAARGVAVEQHRLRRGDRRKDRKSCARAGQKRKRGKPCCKGLEKNSSGFCDQPSTSSCKDPECVGSQVCTASGCVCPDDDPPCEGACLSTTDYCGQCGTRCAEGETCNGNSCQCGELPDACKSDETCDGTKCVPCESPNEVCGGRCQTCPDPPQNFTGFGGQCCPEDSSGETFCSCGTGRNKCSCKDDCFVTVDRSGKPLEEFCCSADKNGVVCDDGQGNVACCQDIGPESCTACGYGQLGGKIGSYRRPR